MERRIKFNVYKEWKQFGSRTTLLIKAKDYRGLAMHYYEVASFLDGKGEDSDSVRELGRKALCQLRLEELRIMQRFDPLLRLKILNARDCCVECAAVTVRSVSIAEAQLQKLLPRRRCTAKYGCWCAYTPKLERHHHNPWTEILRASLMP